MVSLVGYRPGDIDSVRGGTTNAVVGNFGAGISLRDSPKFRSVPIVAVTAESNKNQMEKARAAGFNGFIGKPLDPDKFPDQIRRILNGEQVWELG